MDTNNPRHAAHVFNLTHPSGTRMQYWPHGRESAPREDRTDGFARVLLGVAVVFLKEAGRPVWLSDIETIPEEESVPKLSSLGYIVRSDGRICCVWNRRFGGWGFPGGKVEPGETSEEALHRELLEEIGCRVADLSQMFYGPHGKQNIFSPPTWVHVYSVHLYDGEVPREMEVGCPVSWFTKEEFLRWTPFASFTKRFFEAIGAR